MPWSGGVFTQTNGVYTGATIWNSDKNAGTLITSAHHDTHDYDMAQGINACILKDGTNTMTILNLSGTVNATSGIIMVGTVVLASTYGTNNSFFGNAGNFTTTGNQNVGMGQTSLQSITSATKNTALGFASGLVITTGFQNTLIGTSTGNALTTGSANVGIGYLALLDVVDGISNVAIGNSALNGTISGVGNVAIGQLSGQGVNGAGQFNTAIGYSSMDSSTTGIKNVTIGVSANVPVAANDGQLSVQNALYGTGNTGSSSTVSTGNLGAYVQAPTARFHLPAGTATAGTAPLKLTSGTVLGTPENGAIEFDGTHLYVTISGVRKTVTVT